ncbi:MAG: molybdopterin-synthase adenylyltransferase MoeB [Limnochordales bacterium]|nr:molybdopterin-synthase adenylyltransferase MoeB [Limnochordales bacterium]
MFPFTEDEIVRYSRNIILQEVGGVGQQKLKDARVLVVGAGGLGSPAALYLAAAGVGTIGIVDHDTVDLSNLQRQILHRTQDVGKPKVESARRALEDLNPGVRVETYPVRLTAANVMDLIRDYDVVVDGVDNFATRYLLNDACVMAGKPLVDAGILRWDGLMMTIKPGEGPCYRCVFPEPPPAGVIPTCQEAGVIGALAGVMGTLQAMEVIKLLLGVGQTLTGRLLLFDGLEGRFRQVSASRDPNCPVCGDNPTVTELVEYDLACDLPGTSAPAGAADRG